MNTLNRSAASDPVMLGDLVAAVFDDAALVTTEPAERTRLAASRLGRLLGRHAEARVAALFSPTRSGEKRRLPNRRVDPAIDHHDRSQAAASF